jgi:hypothetical protein
MKMAIFYGGSWKKGKKSTKKCLIPNHTTFGCRRVGYSPKSVCRIMNGAMATIGN